MPIRLIVPKTPVMANSESRGNVKMVSRWGKMLDVRAAQIGRSETNANRPRIFYANINSPPSTPISRPTTAP